MWQRTLWILLFCSTLLCTSCDKSGNDASVSQYATSRPSDIPDTQPEIGPKPHNGPNLTHEPMEAKRPVKEGPFPLTKVEGKEVTLEDGLKYIDLKVGTGADPVAHLTVWVDYVGWLEDGTMFDTSLNKGTALHFWLGEKHVIAGWDEGIATMKAGGKRRLIIPPSLGYGGMGSDKIPPNATLIFDVELLAVSNE